MHNMHWSLHNVRTDRLILYIYIYIYIYIYNISRTCMHMALISLSLSSSFTQTHISDTQKCTRSGHLQPWNIRGGHLAATSLSYDSCHNSFSLLRPAYYAMHLPSTLNYVPHKLPLQAGLKYKVSTKAPFEVVTVKCRMYTIHEQATCLRS